jgi:GTP-binding protein EngB required for normal cell division
MSDTLLEDLKTQIASRRAVLLIGSGVSIASTQDAPAASWTGLLNLGVQRCVDLDPTLFGDWQQRTTADVASPRIDDVLAGASKVRRTLERQGEWSRWLADTIGQLRVARPELIGALGALEAPILTTNYDDLLERTLNRQSITWRDAVDQISFTRQESRDTVLHVHGFWRQPESVILDVADYQRVVGDHLTQTSLQTLGEAWSLVFVGCGDGLTDPNFEQFLDWIATVLKGARHRHFRLERAEDVPRRQQWHNDRGHRVRVLPYGNAYADLPAFLRSLGGPGAPEAHVDASLSPDAPRTRPALRAGEYIRLQEKGRGAVRQLITLANQLGWTGILGQGAELSETLEQDPYRVAIVGRSRAGKSTMLNALIGREICPVEQVLTTAIPIIVGPGETETATVCFATKGRSPVQFDGPITSDMLAPYADQRHNPNNTKQVDRIEVRLGHAVLDLGVEYVDIPGFDDPSGKIWSSTNEVIRRAHALVLVMDVSTYDSGGFAFDKATRELMESAEQRACPVLVVCNKADKLTPADQTGAARHLREELERFGLFAGLPASPFFLSARKATEARARNETLPRPLIVFEEALWGSFGTPNR